jgi:hypothetical protein
MVERIVEDWDGITVTFVSIDDFGQEDIDRIATQDKVANLTVVWALYDSPMPPARMAKLLALPKTSCATAWCLPPEVAATLAEFRDWYMPRLREVSANSWCPEGLSDMTLLKGINKPEVSDGDQDGPQEA